MAPRRSNCGRASVTAGIGRRLLRRRSSASATREIDHDQPRRKNPDKHENGKQARAHDLARIRFGFDVWYVPHALNMAETCESILNRWCDATALLPLFAEQRDGDPRRDRDSEQYEIKPPRAMCARALARVVLAVGIGGGPHVR